MSRSDERAGGHIGRLSLREGVALNIEFDGRRTLWVVSTVLHRDPRRPGRTLTLTAVMADNVTLTTLTRAYRRTTDRRPPQC